MGYSYKQTLTKKGHKHQHLKEKNAKRWEDIKNSHTYKYLQKLLLKLRQKYTHPKQQLFINRLVSGRINNETTNTIIVQNRELLLLGVDKMISDSVGLADDRRLRQRSLLIIANTLLRDNNWFRLNDDLHESMGNRLLRQQTIRRNLNVDNMFHQTYRGNNFQEHVRNLINQQRDHNAHQLRDNDNIQRQTETNNIFLERPNIFQGRPTERIDIFQEINGIQRPSERNNIIERHNEITQRPRTRQNPFLRAIVRQNNTNNQTRNREGIQRELSVMRRVVDVLGREQQQIGHLIDLDSSESQFIDQ